jgi:hypothetical protein
LQLTDLARGLLAGVPEWLRALQLSRVSVQGKQLPISLPISGLHVRVMYCFETCQCFVIVNFAPSPGYHYKFTNYTILDLTNINHSHTFFNQ